MNKFVWFFGFLFFATLSLLSQVPEDSINKNPYFAILNFEYNLSSDHYDPNIASHSLPPKTVNRTQKAEELKKILDGKGLIISAQKAPKDPNYYDSTFHRNAYYPIASMKEIYLEKVGDKWYFSQETVDKIPELYNDTFKFNFNVKEYFSGAIWSKNFFGTTVLSWFFFILLILLCFLVKRISSKIYNRVIRYYMRKTIKEDPTYNQHIQKSGEVLGLYFASLLFMEVLPSIQLPIGWNSFLQKAVGISSVIFIIIFLCRIVDGIYYNIEVSRKAKNKTHNTQYQTLIKKVVKIVIIVFGSFYIMYYYLNVNIESIFAGLSIGGLALAIASQDTVKNLIGSVVILMDKPFEVNDWIQFDKEEGIVEEVGVRSTRVRSFDNSVIYVPNSTISNGIVNNKGLRKFRRLKLILTIEYSTPVPAVEKYIEQLRHIIKQQEHTVKDNYDVYLNDFSESGLNIHFSCFLKVKDSKEEFKTRQTILLEILKLSNELEVKTAFPSRSLYIEDEKKSELIDPNNQKDEE